MSNNSESKIGYWAVVSIGIGGMVGGGIFAVLGLAVQLAHGGTPFAFLIAGLLALITSYSYARLSVRFPDQGGTVVFIDKAFGVDLFTGTMNNLLWLSYIVMLSLYAYAFGSYGATLFGTAHFTIAKHIIISIGILLPALLNMLNAKAIGRAESYVVAVKVTILLFFIIVGIQNVEIQRLAPTTWTPMLPLLAGGMIIFLAYEGFELIANTARDVQNSRVTLPRAFYTSVVFVILLYFLIAVVAVGTLPIDRIVEAKDYALAAAARPSLGSFGFTLIAFAAMLSTFSAINATLYGAARLTYTIAKEGELPEFLEKKVWKKPLEGLIITTFLALLLANVGDLSSISTMGSAGFLAIFAAVNAANVVLARQTGSSKSISIAGLLLCLVALAALVWQTSLTQPASLWILAAMLLISFMIEFIYRRWRRKPFRLGPGL